MAQETASTRATSGKGLFSFAHVFKPTAMDENSEPKYNTQFIWSKKDKATTKKFEAAIKVAEDAYIAKEFNGKKPKDWATPIRDGDEEEDKDQEIYGGNYFIAAKSYRKPKVVDRAFNVLTDEEDFYSGCFGAICINFFGYSKGKNKGISAGLESIMKFSDGEALGGSGGNVKSDFAEFEDMDDDDFDL